MNYEDREIEYQEIFKRTTEDPGHVIKSVKEVYENDYRWEIGEPVITDLQNGKYLVEIPLTKYRTKGISR